MEEQKPTIILGLGMSGVSLLRYFQSIGTPVQAWDTRENPPGLADIQAQFQNVKINLCPFDAQALMSAQQLAISPGIPLKTPDIQRAIQSGVPVVNDLELFLCNARAPIIAVTGSNGKSTVVSLLGEMFARAGKCAYVIGNIGDPMLDSLEKPKPDAYILELSSFQLASVSSMHSQTAVCLNLSPDHLDWHIDLEDYCNCKRRIYTNCTRPVFNRDDPTVYSTLDCADSGVSFGLNVPKNGQFGLASIDGQEMLMFGDQQLMPAEQICLRGRHQFANALAALALGQAAGLEFDAMIETLKTFQGLPHRTQYLGVHRGLHWVNDSKATNLSAALAALEGVGASTSGKIILLAGGQPKEPDYSALQAPLKQYGRAAIVFGQAAGILQAAIAEACPVVRVESLKEAVDSAIGLAQAGDTILLAPACASFDQFKNYQARGDVFMRWVAD